MTLPKSVQAQSDAAEAARSTAYTEEPEHTPPTAAQPEPEPKPEPVQPEPETRDAAYWRHRFEVLQGKYNAEVKEIPPLRQKIKDLEAQIEQQKSSQGNASDVKSALLEGLPESVVEEYGTELIDAIAKIAANASSANKPTADPDVETLKTQVQSMTEERQQERTAQMMTDLEQAVPDWKELQSSQAGQDWLYAYDPKTGRQRNDILISAANNFHTQAVINVYRDMKSDIAGRKPPEEKIQPNQSRSTTQTPANGRTWTRAEINQFYKDRTQPGKYSDEQAKTIEQDIFAAQTEGRIIG